MDKAYNYALSILAKREYARSELMTKLLQKGFDSVIIESVIAKLMDLNLQSDERYAEMICRTRVKQGYGPLRISQELNLKQIDSSQVNDLLREEQDNWVSHALAMWHKKYNRQAEYSVKEQQKQKSFLYARGFSMDTIAQVFECLT